MPRLDLNHLIDLEALLSEGSVTGAARRLHLSAPAMSRRLANLRDALGDPLFVLAGRRLVPTVRAITLGKRLGEVLEDARELLTPASVDLATVEQTLTIRASDGFTGAWASRLVARMSSEAPGVRLFFKPRADKDVEALRNGSVDLDIGVLGEAGPEIQSQMLTRMTFVGVVRSGHPVLDDDKPIDALRFTRWPHISVSRRGMTRGPVDDGLDVLGLRRQVVVVAPGFQAALAMVRDSDLIAVMPEHYVLWSGEPDRLRSFPLPVKTREVSVSMYWHPRVQADPLHSWLREHVRSNMLAQQVGGETPRSTKGDRVGRGV